MCGETTVDLDHANPHDSCQWQAVKPDGFRWLQWPTENSLFSRETGETHLLSELPAFLLRCLSEKPCSFETVCKMTANVCDAANDEHWRKIIADLLASLADSELAECQ
jgi:hypothetical protein